MTASVDVAIPVAKPGFEIPLTAFTQKDGGTFVFIVEPATTTVSKRAVTVDSPTAGGLRVTSGLTQGDLVVVAGVQFLTPGQPVRLDTAATTTALR
jgi:multidrug efflux pump subunit AcrA (membrane-fusion protein)